ncbi:MAG: putative toxin-antitoxin system toxin component, PIN family [Candidatus Woesearchaeota archaeon]
MGKKKIVIDTNILISGFAYKGNEHKLLRKINEYNNYLSLSQISEIEKVLKYPKFEITHEFQKNILEWIKNNSNIIDIKTKTNICRDSKDNIIIETAIDGKAEFIITGDKDLLELKKVKNIAIISTKDFLKLQ